MLRCLSIILLVASSLLGQVYGPYSCDQSTVVTTTSSGAIQIVPAANQSIRVCSIDINVMQPVTPANFGLVYGSGSNCATNQTVFGIQWTGVAGALQTYVKEIPPSVALFAPGGNALCLNLSAAPTSASVHILWKYY